MFIINIILPHLIEIVIPTYKNNKSDQTKWAKRTLINFIPSKSTNQNIADHLPSILKTPIPFMPRTV